MKRRRRFTILFLTLGALFVCAAAYRVAAQARQTLSAAFQRQVLVPPGEAPFNLRFFTTAVKTDSRGRIITGLTSDPVKKIVGAEPAGLRAGIARFTKIMFGANYF